jgi:type III restriction enzyme
MKELRERPSKLDIDFLVKRKINGQRINDKFAKEIVFDFIKNGYLNKDEMLTEKYHHDLRDNKLQLSDNLKQNLIEIVTIVKDLYEVGILINNENEIRSIQNKLNKNFENKEFKKFWDYISSKTTYEVNFDSKLIVDNSVKVINQSLDIVRLRAEITEATSRDRIKRSDIEDSKFFGNKKIDIKKLSGIISSSIKYDLIGELVKETNLTRKTISEILTKIDSDKFGLYQENPEDFILKVAGKINDEKAEIILQKIKYSKTGSKLSLEIFKNNKFLNSKILALEANKYIYDYLDYDSDVEMKFASDINSYVDVLVFSKLPKGEYEIYTPVGKFSPDWMIVFDKQKIRHAYFVAETKGKLGKFDLKGVEKAKIECARKHFQAISEGNVKFDAVVSFEELKNKLELVS